MKTKGFQFLHKLWTWYSEDKALRIALSLLKLLEWGRYDCKQDGKILFKVLLSRKCLLTRLKGCFCLENELSYTSLTNNIFILMSDLDKIVIILWSKKFDIELPHIMRHNHWDHLGDHETQWGYRSERRQPIKLSDIQLFGSMTSTRGCRELDFSW